MRERTFCECAIAAGDVKHQCINCKFWLRSWVEPSDMGWCQHPVVEEKGEEPPNFCGHVYPGDAGPETHKAAGCDGWAKVEVTAKKA